MSVRFFHATHGTVDIQNPERGNELPHRIPHATGRTASGKFFAYKKGITIKTMRLSWNELREEEYTALQTFFEAVEGPSTVFTYTDHFGVSWTAWFTVDELPWKNEDDYAASSGYFLAGAKSYPTTVRNLPVWSLSIELEVEV